MGRNDMTVSELLRGYAEFIGTPEDDGPKNFGIAVTTGWLKRGADEIDRLTAENARLEAERDAAVMDIRKLSELTALPCVACKYNTGDFVCRPECSGCSPAGSHWQWRGAQPATGAEERSGDI